jgi:dolichol-phosphate mannosyltransferase
MNPDISIVIPTYNESENIPILLSGLKKVLSESSIENFEILVMDDDSPDGTCQVVQRLGDPRFKAINRRGKPRGLSYAVIDGMGEAKGHIVGVMDADLSHPCEAVPRLVQALKQGANLAIGSRYVKGGGISNWPFKRRLASRVACLFGRLVTPVKDCTSGFFFFRQSTAKGLSLNPRGFKIGLEMFVKSPHQNKIVEVPYVFTDRQKGQSKLSGFVISCYLHQVWTLFFQRLKKH